MKTITALVMILIIQYMDQQTGQKFEETAITKTVFFKKETHWNSEEDDPYIKYFEVKDYDFLVEFSGQNMEYILIKFKKKKEKNWDKLSTEESQTVWGKMIEKYYPHFPMKS